MATPFMLTWQHVENAKQLMTALAVVEAMGNRDTADLTLRYARTTAQTLTVEDNRPTSAVELLALKAQSAAHGDRADRALVMTFLAALAMELGLEPDETARQEAAALITRARR
ncbi:MAG: hypothetical protein IVW57_00090 [Ktedonobacterales bacterium]|nr:hypothetical protein [Ktedonobacterales bacterium]